jgi:uncharacterized membrane protein YbhN (UPF0104 family)
MKSFIKERILFIFKYLTGLALLVWILSRVDRSQIFATLTEVSIPVFLLIFLLVIINLGSQFSRWKYLIESNSNHYDTRDLLPSFFAGFAFRLMIPGGHAEISKIFLMPGKKNGKIFAFGIEKFFQTFIKLLLVLVALPLVFPDLKIYFWSLTIVVIAAYFIIPRVLKFSFFSRMQEREVHYPKIFLRTLVYSIAVFICMTLQYYLLINQVHEIGLGPTALVVIFILGAGLLPISVSGLGVRENLAVFFLAQYAIPGSTAVGFSLLVFVLNAIIPALVGVYFIMAKRQHLKDARGALSSVKHRLSIRNKVPQFGDVNQSSASDELLLKTKTEQASS